MTARGTLILVVGPSGAGKDSIIAGAAERLRGDPRILLARRLITRPAEAGGEDHIPVSSEEFAERRETGALLLHWQAHGLDYGLPAELGAALEQRRSVVANVSRTVIGEARHRFAPTLVVAIAASPETLATRLAGRGRESEADIAERLRRGDAMAAVDADVTIDNNGTLDAAVECFAAVLRCVIDQPVSA
ncbi:MAG TPA: phosphonate metabolism protein/1,5-bisphosphokinase (PRPP-forming) PhnN [Stellaceae bacterium]|nr:phosphonate metabolism protein/1,5-bisphosphokinase (PRPP-forming) PhnN [Stellaceae bacterium]